MRTFGVLAAFGTAAVGIAARYLDPAQSFLAETVAMAVFAVACGMALAGLRATYPHARLGACNVVTLTRAAAASVLCVAVVSPSVMDSGSAAIFVIATGALALDGVDGYLARRSGLASAFGARFDMEIDAALAAILSLILIRSAGVDGPVALISLTILGFARYAFVAASLWLTWLDRPLPRQFSRSAVCVVQIATLAVLLLPVAADLLGAVVLPLVAALVAWSFGRDVIWLARTRASDSR